MDYCCLMIAPLLLSLTLVSAIAWLMYRKVRANVERIARQGGGFAAARADLQMEIDADIARLRRMLEADNEDRRQAEESFVQGATRGVKARRLLRYMDEMGIDI